MLTTGEEGQQGGRRPTVVLGGGGALVAGSRREDAPRTRLDVAQLLVVSAPPIDAHPHRIAGWPAAEGRFRRAAGDAAHAG
jgi:hypothetical protein